MVACNYPTCQKTIVLEVDGSPPRFCICCGYSLPLNLFRHLLSADNCHGCGKLCCKRLDGSPSLYCSRCGESKVVIVDQSDKALDESKEDVLIQIQDKKAIISQMYDGMSDGDVLDLSEVEDADPKPETANESMTSSRDNIDNLTGNQAISTLYLCDSCPEIFTSSDHLAKHKKFCAKFSTLQQKTVRLAELSEHNQLSNESSTPNNVNESESCENSEEPADKFVYCLPCNRYYSDDTVHHHTCGSVVKSKTNRTRHTETEDKGKDKKCEICSKIFASSDLLTKHLGTHLISKSNETGLWICSKCNYFSSSKQDCKMHEMTHFPKTVPCPICPKMFRRKSNLSDHMNTHTGEKPYKCDKCGEAFNNRSHHANHRRNNCKIVRKIKKLCPECGKYYSSLPGHIREIHLRIQPFKCDTCGRTFPKKSKLVEHIRVHTGEKPYKCNFCDYGSKQKSYLAVHMSKCKNRPDTDV